jgi:hypothetical protein
VRAGAGSLLAVGRVRPSESRWCRKRLSPDDERDVDEAGPRRDVGEVRDPK